MTIRRLVMWLMIAAALVGMPWVQRHNQEDPLFSRLAFLKVYSSLGLYQEIGLHELLVSSMNEYYKTLPPEQAKVFSNDPQELFSLAQAHPDRPWYLWRWWQADPDHHFIPSEEQLFAVAERTPELREKIEKFRKDAEFMRERDPDNGWPLILLAYLDALEGIVVSFDSKTRELQETIVNPELASRAARYLHQAMAKEKFTQYTQEATREWNAIMGNRDTVANVFPVSIQRLFLPYFSFPMFRLFTLRLSVEAKRRASLSENDIASSADGGTAEELSRDMQTLGAKLVAGGSYLSDILIAQSVMSDVTENCAQILRNAGQPEAAERLLVRGRAMLYP